MQALDISTEGYEILLSPDFLEQINFCAALETMGDTPGLVAFGINRGLLSTSEFGLEARKNPRTSPRHNKSFAKNAPLDNAAKDGAKSALGDASHTAAHEASAGFVAKLKGWAVAALKKLTDFGKYVQDKATGFGKAVGEKVNATKALKTGAKVPAVAEVTAGVAITATAATAFTRMAQSVRGIFRGPEALNEAKTQVAEAISSVKSPAGKFIAANKGGKMDMKFTAATEALADTATKAVEGAAQSGWSKSALSRVVGSFGNGSRMLWTALTTVASALRSVVSSGVSWAAKGAKSAIGLGDKGASGAIKYMQGKQALGGIKGIFFGLACITFITWLVNTILKMTRDTLNSASNMVRNTVDSLCGTSST